MARCEIRTITEGSNSAVEKLQAEQLHEQPDTKLAIQVINQTIRPASLQKIRKHHKT